MRRIFVGIVFLLILFWGLFDYFRNKKVEKLKAPESKIINVDDGIRVLGVRTTADTVEKFIKSENIKLNQGDQIYPDLKTKINGGMQVSIKRAVLVVVKVDGKIIKKRVLASKVGEALNMLNITLNSDDKVVPSLEQPIYNDLEIIITRIKHKEIIEEEPIDFEIVDKKDSTLKWKARKVKQKGKKGLREVKYLVTYKNGKEVNRKKISSKVKVKPVEEIRVVGTKIKVGKTQRGRASWYAYTGKMAAASTTFPKGTWLRITAVNSGKQVFVQVNDYGPDPGTGKILDLDREAFKKLAPLGAGVIEVKIEEIK